jgi:hypothetical protein
VNTNLKNEYITGTPDMTPSGIQPEVDAIKADQQKIAAAQKTANVPASQQFTFTPVEAPSCSVAGKHVDNGNAAQCFARYMRIHALGSSNGLTYSQMGQYAAKPDAPPQFTDFNGGTSDTTYAQTDAKTGKPVSNGTRNLWVTETALTTALYLAFTGHLDLRDRRRRGAPAHRGGLHRALAGRTTDTDERWGRCTNGLGTDLIVLPLTRHETRSTPDASRRSPRGLSPRAGRFLRARVWSSRR